MMITTGVLDDFNTGASQNLRSATRTGWNAVGVQNFNGALATDVVPTFASGVNADAAWGTSLTADQEVWVTFSAFSNAGNQSIYARMATINSPGDYYRLTRTSATDNWFMSKRVSGVDTAIGSGFTQAISVGDSIGLSLVGATISTWYKASGGSWVQKDTATDSDITVGGFIGIDCYVSGIQFDAFGGGNVVAAASTVPRRSAIRRA